MTAFLNEQQVKIFPRLCVQNLTTKVPAKQMICTQNVLAPNVENKTSYLEKFRRFFQPSGHISKSKSN